MRELHYFDEAGPHKELHYFDPVTRIYTQGPHQRLYNSDNLRGQCCGIYGNAEQLAGDCSHNVGDVTGLSGTFPAYSVVTDTCTGLIGDITDYPDYQSVEIN
jgi:hypothetical protein